jgi:hypothetical protein
MGNSTGMKKILEFNQFKQEREDGQIAEKIKDTLLEFIDGFPVKNKLHVLSRLQSAYPGESYSTEMKNIVPELESILRKNFQNVEKIKDPSASSNDIRLYDILCSSYFSLQRNNLLYLIDGDLISSCLEYIRKHFIGVMQAIIKNDEIMINKPACPPRILYYAKSIGLVPEKRIKEIEDDLFSSAEVYFKESELQSPKKFDNYIYFLTHVILGEINFYTSKILSPNKRMEKILKFFESNSERIIKECTWDKIVEVGVCLKYAGRPTEIYKNAVKKILNEKGIIGMGGPYKYKLKMNMKEEIEKKEHSNILAVLLFSDMN